MIIDSFIFHNESDMLEFRLKLLWDVVDKFVIIEADRAFSGKIKPFNFITDKHRFDWAKEKIVYMPINVDVFDLNLDAPPPEKWDDDHFSWRIENRQRTAIIDACKYFSNTDILMVSDCDEIPSAQAVEFRKNNNLMYPMTCDQFIIPYKLNYMRPDMGWRGTVMCDLSYARQVGTQTLRNERQRYSPFPKGGWHLSYFGGADMIRNKIECFAHQEINRDEFKDIDHINDCIKWGKSLLKEDVSLDIIDASFYPQYFLDKVPKEWWL